MVCLGKDAQPAIPLLIEKSRGLGLSYPGENNHAIEALGRLCPYDPDRIIPHLIGLLDQPGQAAAAAKALENIGEPARSAEKALRRNLLVAVDAKQDDVAVALISALGRLGRPRPTVAILIPLLERPGEADAAAKALDRIGPQAKPAVAALINRLYGPDTGWQERGDDISALIAIDLRSPVVLKAALEELARAEDAVEDYLSAAALTKVRPFPPALAPALVAAIERRDSDDLVRHMLQETLAHTDTTLKPANSSRSPPEDVGDRLSDGLWALTVQSQPIVPDDLVKQLHIDRNDYLQEGNPISRAWQRKSVPAGDPAGVALIHSIHLLGVWPSVAGLPDKQQLDIVLSDRFCMSVDDLKTRIAGPEPEIPDPSVVIVSADSGLDPGTLRFEGDHSADKSKARSSLISLGTQCHGHIRIEKSFDPGYWNYVCPFAYDRGFADNLIIPTLRKQLGPGFGQFDFDTPQITDEGWVLRLTYRELVQDPARDGWHAARLSLFLDRCSHSVSEVSKYIP